ncbi:DUF7524 family protein [Halorussus aquaticus]|uniref:Uncharacterized protein n=1 Tax=Halorussus aquaticus TaxID=2953748 RepID=A0ABD5PXN2_9EURY|nr:hypothetical protein [Halorussus aquaticus]
MPDSLPVRLNDDRLHDIQTRTSFETADSFPILLHNGDAPVHVHLHLDDALSSVASIPANNHFVDANSTQQVDVEVADGPRAVEGQVKIVTGHGAETDYVTVSIVEPEEGEEVVDVDETLAAPVRDEDDEDADDGYELPDLSLGRNAPVAVLGVLAITVAAGSATLSDSVAVLFGALAVLASVVAAGYLLAR